MSGLAGKHVVITRASHQAGEFAQRLEAHGAVPLLYPCVEIRPAANTEVLDAKITQMFAGSFDWLVLTSQNAVFALSSRIKELRICQPLPAQLRFAAVGRSTSIMAKELLGVSTQLMPKTYNAKSLAEMFGNCSAQKMLLPQTDIANPELVDSLRVAGAIVFPVVAYQTKKGRGGIHLLEHLNNQSVDIITFASPSAVRFFKERFLEEGGSLSQLKLVCIACIGNVTQNAASNAGFDVSLVPEIHTSEALVQLLDKRFT